MRAFLERWGLVLSAVFAALLLIFLASCVGCSLVEGARDAALEEVTGTPSPGKPSGSSGAALLLYTIGATLTAVVGGYFLKKKMKSGLPPA